MSLCPDRQKWVGASEASILFGLNPYKTRDDLWLEKAGLVDPPDLSDNWAILAGNALEPIIAAQYALENSLQLHRSTEYMTHPEVQLGASGDYINSETGDPVEIKTVGDRAFGSWPEGGSLAPTPYVLQLQVQMLLCGAERGTLVALVNNRELKEYHYTAQPGLQALIVQEVARFWKSVDSGERPALTYKDNPDAMQKVMLAEEVEIPQVEATDEQEQLLANFVEARDIKKRAEEKMKEVKAEIMDALFRAGNARKMVTSSGLRVNVSETPEKIVPAKPESVRPALLRFMVTKPRAK